MELIHGGLEGQLVQALLRGAGGLERGKCRGGRGGQAAAKRVEEEEETGEGGERIRSAGERGGGLADEDEKQEYQSGGRWTNSLIINTLLLHFAGTVGLLNVNKGVQCLTDRPSSRPSFAFIRAVRPQAFTFTLLTEGRIPDPSQVTDLKREE